MTHTVQFRSKAMSVKTGNEPVEYKGETEDDSGFLYSIFDNMSDLSIALNKLDNLQNDLCKKIAALERAVRDI